MTAEVVILNKQAVALAADSAVTTHSRYGDKIYNTVNKLYMLSKYHPVGIMVYGSAEIMGLPIETVIKSFRSQQGHKEYLNLHDYAEAFQNFIIEDNKLFSVQYSQNHCINI